MIANRQDSSPLRNARQKATHPEQEVELQGRAGGRLPAQGIAFLAGETEWERDEDLPGPQPVTQLHKDRDAAHLVASDYEHRPASKLQCAGRGASKNGSAGRARPGEK